MPYPAAPYAEKLLAWYDVHLRSLPWRIPPQQQAQGIKPDPYRIWLSEVMLQQTTTEAVRPYFTKFTEKWGNLAALSAAPLTDILKAWAGLGYYSRARNLKTCADRLMAEYGGEFPQTAAELRKLPGIGDYTSAAIAAIAFNEPCAVIDANVERVIARLFCITEPLPAARSEIRSACQNLVPHHRPGDFAQAVMDLGATLCSVKKPNCLLCPLHALCLARQNGMAETLPHKPPKPMREERCGAAFIAVSDTGKIYLQQRPAKGLLGGMSEVPNFFAPAKQNAKNSGDAAEQADVLHRPFAGNWRFQGNITHIFTHFRLTLAVYKAENIAENAERLTPPEAFPVVAAAAAAAPASAATESLPVRAQQGFWVKIEDLAGEALPTVMKKALNAALPHSPIFQSK